jgi:hypothetical protein
MELAAKAGRRPKRSDVNGAVLSSEVTGQVFRLKAED